MRYYYSYRLFVTCSRASRPPISSPALMGVPLITFSSPHIEWNWEARRLNLAALNLIIQRALFSATFKSAQFPPPLSLVGLRDSPPPWCWDGMGDLSFYSSLLRHSFWVLLTWYIHLSRFLSFFILPSVSCSYYLYRLYYLLHIVLFFFFFFFPLPILLLPRFTIVCACLLPWRHTPVRLGWWLYFFLFLFDVCV